jgi:hypothetical protein
MSVGACDMNGGEPLLEDCKRLNRTRLNQIRISRRAMYGWRRRGWGVHGWRSDAWRRHEAWGGSGNRRAGWYFSRRLRDRKRRGARRRRHVRDLQLRPHLLEGKAVGRLRPFLPRQLPREIVDRFLEIGIVARQAQRGPIVRERLSECAAPVMNFREATNGGKILGCALDHHLQFTLRIVDVSELDERPAQRDTRRQIARMNGEPGAADFDGLSMLPRPPVLLRELSERDRRRILLDPASKVFNPAVVHHQNAVTAMLLEMLALTPALSVTVKVTMKVPAFV